MSDRGKSGLQLWARRGAFMYALGAWTVVSYCLSQYLFRGQTDKDPNPRPEDRQGNENNLPTTASKDTATEKTVYISPGQTMFVSMQTTYKKNFVPYTTRLQNSILSSSNESDDKEK